ncbi:ferritin-like domain-containing protein [Rhodocyclaceae bacterium SMB388]
MSSSVSVHRRAAAALLIDDPDHKCAAVLRVLDDWRTGRCVSEQGVDDPDPVSKPGRPRCPELVDPQRVPRRRVTTPEGHAALLHAIAHIEFNAINLALDCVMRFRSFPAEFHQGWLQVAAEEAMHFGLVRDRLRALGFDYGDFVAHNGLWQMACKTAGDPLARMALVPRVLEARGLDATPPIIAKLRKIGDTESVAVLDIILRDEVGHVALGDRWFKRLCAERGLEPEQTYLDLIDSFDAPRPQPPMHDAARLAAGFSVQELAHLTALARR